MHIDPNVFMLDAWFYYWFKTFYSYQEWPGTKAAGQNCPTMLPFQSVLLKILPLWHWPLSCQYFLPSRVTKSLALGTWHLFQLMLCFSSWICDFILSMISIRLKLCVAAGKCSSVSFGTSPQTCSHCPEPTLYLPSLNMSLSKQKLEVSYKQVFPRVGPGTTLSNYLSD